MTGLLLNTLAWLLAGALLTLTLRRMVLLGAALLPPRPRPTQNNLPSVTLLVPARNEEIGIGGTLQALDRLDYPADRLFIVLINDGSDDSTGHQFESWAAGCPHARVLTLVRPRGKIQALNTGVTAAPDSELIAVCDADLRPDRDWLRRLAEAFADPAVGGAAAFLSPVGADNTPVSRYAAVESWVHQLVTSAGKDRLDLNPATNGASAYRRTALESLGWFGVGVSEDDVRTTVGLTRANWRTRFVQTAVVENMVVQDWRAYWLQHIRWAHNLSAAAAAPRQVTARRAGLARELEAWMLTAGYNDRLVFAAVLGLAAYGRLPLWLPCAYLAAIGGQIAAALIKARAGSHFVLFFFSTVMFHAVDVIASAAAAIGAPVRRSYAPRRTHDAAFSPSGEAHDEESLTRTT